jgi:hypothetical protein
MTAIAMVNDDDQSRWLHPTVASIDYNRLFLDFKKAFDAMDRE